ncbi:MAG TPA: hypothetical protein VFX59_13580 [Polyangiales bacterium]|nr:hypothetical protein [Polyangiales bacterium]
MIDPTSKRASRQPGSTATPVVERTPPETLRHAPPEQPNKVGSDRGDAPVEPEVLVDTDSVDPISVGATPVYNATPLEVQPVDATPADVAVGEVTPLVIEPIVEAVEAKPTETAKPKPPKKSGNGPAKKPSVRPPAPDAKEKLAPASGAAKSVARSGTKAKSSGGKGGKTSKKK